MYLVEPCLFWPAQDEDRYEGLWNVPTSATILLISRVYDPATPHTSAVAASQTLANARLLTIDGWGHSYFEGGRSTCANEIMATYLIDLELPAPDTVCPEDTPPFSELLMDESSEATPVPSPEVQPQSVAFSRPAPHHLLRSLSGGQISAGQKSNVLATRPSVRGVDGAPRGQVSRDGAESEIGLVFYRGEDVLVDRDGSGLRGSYRANFVGDADCRVA